MYGSSNHWEKNIFVCLRKVHGVCQADREFVQYYTQKVENWLDSQEVCLLLGFSKRTLQYYRSSGRLAYSQIGSKIYYKSSDIERIIADSETQNQSPKQITSYEKI